MVDSVEEEREREVLIELDDFDDCIEEKEDTGFSMDWTVKLLVFVIKKLNYCIEVILFITCKTYKMF